MNKRLLIIEVGVFIAIAILLISAGVIKRNNSSINKIINAKSEITAVDKIQVFMFHSTKRCSTCIAIGKLSGETVNEYFSQEVALGKIEFKEINIDLPENKELAQKFQASGSSLFINTIYDNQDHIRQDIDVWRLTTTPARFKNYLKTELEKYSFN